MNTEDEDRRRFDPDHKVLSFNEYFDKALAEQRDRTPSVEPKDYLTTGKGAATENEVWWRNAGPGMVAAWRRWLDSQPFVVWQTPSGEPAIELEMSVVVEGTRVDGFIDRILARVEDPDVPYVIVDLKSGKPPKKPKQLWTYGLMCAEQGWYPPLGGYFMVKGGVLTGMTNIQPNLSSMEYEFEEAAKAIRADIFPARTSGLCQNWCGVNKYCYAGGYMTDTTYLPFPGGSK